jgi:hypothetical protein
MNHALLTSLRCFILGWLAINSTLALAIEVPPSAKNPTNDPYSRFQWGLVNQGQVLLDEADDLHTRRLIGVPGADIGFAFATVPLAYQIWDYTEQGIRAYAGWVRENPNWTAKTCPWYL